MLQRIQTLYLLLSTIISGGIIFLLSFWKDNNDNVIYLVDLLNNSNWTLRTLIIVFILSSFMSFVSIFKYKNRKQQISINRLNIVVNFYLLGIIVYHLLTLSGENQISEKGIGLFIPVMVIVLLVFANKSILKDEKLVKSADRLR